jgi:hypothetical protein
MKAFHKAGIAMAAAASLTACASGRAGGGETTTAGMVDVNRTHLGQPVARAQIAVEARDPSAANSPDFRVMASAVERQLVRLGYTIAPNRATSEQIALIHVQQGGRAALMSGWPGGMTAGGRSANLVATLLDVRLRRRSDATVFWQGRAVTEGAAGSPGANRAAAVEKLAEALFRDFPGESGRTIRVR